MALTSATTLVIGSQAWFIPEGTAYTLPAAGTVSAESKPEAADTAWVRLYAVTNFEVTPPNGDEIEIFEPSPGRLRRTRVLRTKKKMDATSGENLTMLSGGDVHGWLHFQQYDQDDVLRWTGELYCNLILDGAVAFDPTKAVEIKLKVMEEYSSLSTVQFA
jgi:hypothetical protein